MPPLSYNSTKQKGNLKRVLLVAICLLIASLAYVGGYFTPKIVNDIKFSKAEKTAHEFVTHVSTGNYAAARNMGSESFKKQFESDETLKTAMAGLKAEKPEYKASTSFKVGNGELFTYSQVVDGFPASENGLTDLGINVDLINIQGKWQVVSFFIE